MKRSISPNMEFYQIVQEGTKDNKTQHLLKGTKVNFDDLLVF